MMRLLQLVGFISLLALPSLAALPLPLGENEALTYRVAWALFPGAGEIHVTAKATADAAGKPALLIVTTTATRGFAKALLTFEARAEAIFDVTTGRMASLSEWTHLGEKKTSHAIALDYEKKTASYTASPNPDARLLPMSAGDPLDLITSLLQTRTWDLKPGEHRDASVLFKDEFYELTIHALGYEEVETKLGTFKTLVLEPRMEKTAPKGMFKKGSKVKVWISQDERRLPVRFQVDFNFGSGVATLRDYRPPVVKIAAAATAEKDAKNSSP